MENICHKASTAENTDTITKDKSAEDFQKFIYELFEKNGVLNDLRAYLRGHIINILKQVEKGGTLMCQKLFTQRLEISFQAVNMLIAEYLLRMDFSYSLSVFISEIPLANMVFEYAKSLLQSKPDDSYQDLRFPDKDVWQILNFIGVQCDSESASNIVNMYSKGESPLLVCLLKSIVLNRNKIDEKDASNLNATASSSSLSTELQLNSATKSELTCKHLAVCGSCKRKMKTYQMQYKNKKRKLCQSLNHSNDNLVNVQKFLRDMDVTEKSVIDEMFEQLKTVYEAEVDMVRQEDQMTMKRTLANQSTLLQKKYEEIEDLFRKREADLESSVKLKKRFLWGLARTLREQHSNMAGTMKTLQMEMERLNAKEGTLKLQISEAEQTLRKRGDEMHEQISSELIILQEHLSSMRREREEIDKGRKELEKLKELYTSNTKIENNKEESNYDALKEELASLKEFLTSKVDKNLTDKAVMTDSIKSQMNNENSLINSKCDAVKSNQLVNDLKKRKNVNFDKENVEDNTIQERNRDYQIELLRLENERLKAFADQQHRHIEELSRDRFRQQSQLWANAGPLRPRTAPPASAAIGVNPSGVGFESGCRKGGGEEVGVFPSSARTYSPDEEVPFIGVVADRRDTKRHLLKQWKSLRRRLSTEGNDSPKAGTSKQVDTTEEARKNPWRVQPRLVLQANITFDKVPLDGQRTHQEPTTPEKLNKSRVKSPKSVLREAKQKLGNKDTAKRDFATSQKRERSPNATLREAKLRLRKLEIEAEAAEKSYQDFRRRSLAEEHVFGDADKVTPHTGPVTDFHYSFKPTMQKEGVESRDHTLYSKRRQELLKKDFNKYLRGYQSREGSIQSYKSSKIQKMSIPDAYTKQVEKPETTKQKINYLETPITDFRKLYHNEKPRKQLSAETVGKKATISNVEYTGDKTKSTGLKIAQEIGNENEHYKDNINNEIDTKPKDNNKKSTKLKEHKSEISISQSDNISSPKETIKPRTVSNILKPEDHKNLLEVEIENVTETTTNYNTHKGFSVVIESSIDAKFLNVTQDTLQNANTITAFLSPEPISTNNSKIDKLNSEIKHLSLDNFSNVEPNTGLSQEIEAKLTSLDHSIESKQDEDINISRKEDSIENELNILEPLKSSTPEKDENITRNDVLDAILDIDEIKNLRIDLEHSKKINSLNDSEEAKEYPDDFSADVDNYNSLSDLGNSPISLPKVSEDDNFWD